jgi:hypothetical protein
VIWVQVIMFFTHQSSADPTGQELWGAVGTGQPPHQVLGEQELHIKLHAVTSR